MLSNKFKLTILALSAALLSTSVYASPYTMRVSVSGLKSVNAPAVVVPPSSTGTPIAVTFASAGGTTNLRTVALSAGWDGIGAVTATLPSGKYLTANSTGIYGLQISGSFPNGVTFINNGSVYGAGGAGTSKDFAANAGTTTQGGTGGNTKGGSLGGVGGATGVSGLSGGSNTTANGGGGGGGAVWVPQAGQAVLVQLPDYLEAQGVPP